MVIPSRSLRYSGRYRPACRMIQIGGRSVFSPRIARRNRDSTPGIGASISGAGGKPVLLIPNLGHSVREGFNRPVDVLRGMGSGQKPAFESAGRKIDSALQQSVEQLAE